ncbi:hypothetical protein GCK72_001308 [Caenorhabditis remanei]|uniref:RanBP2-type domain-containing protein n=1 Tax=Caenorhabditis remanei TaxID=31234 RepID=A0A6A5HQI3_CAERE|nr:hypothetical protein GCK72_001308 [Caenorhabditis remanei]KAF1769491.1 hypothetical protein GCK72_001308 [Caenorhabditis remanei]
MSDKSGGFFSSVGRFFSGGSASKSNEEEKSPSSKTTSFSEGGSSRSPSTAAPAALLRDIIDVDKNSSEALDEVSVDTTQNSRVVPRLRYLSPSVLPQRSSDPTNGLEIDVDPVSDIFFSTPSVSTNRKRQLTELDRITLPQSFRSDSAKRSRYLNRSLLEPTLKSTLPNDKKLDVSWCGELTGNHSPASSVTNFSLLSRRSGATTNGSLSTRTQEIFKKLEGANTPAKEVQRMSMMRAGLTRPETWSSTDRKDHDTSSVATPPPPLKKAGDSIPSRIQLISKQGISARKNPYWTDLTRKRTTSKNGDNGSSETSSLRLLNGTLASTELSSVFSLEPPAPKKTTSSTSTASTTTINSSNSRKPHVSIMKGPDGKAVSRNTFKLNDDIEEDEENSQKLPPLSDEVLSNSKPLQLNPELAPKRGFLDNLSFTFNAPLDVVSAVGTAKTVSVVSSNRTSESKEVDSDSAESIEKQTSESSSHGSDSGESVDSENDADENVDEVKESRPQTSADTISSAEGSNPSNQSSKDSSPKTAKDVDPVAIVSTAASAKWECQSCFCSWDQTLTKCGACQEPRAGAGAPAAQKPAEKQLVSNLKSFAPSQSSNFKFGFGGSSSVPATSSSVPTTTTPIQFGLPTSTTEKSAPVSFGLPTSTTEKSAPVLFGIQKPATSSVSPIVPPPAAAVPATSEVSTVQPSATENRVAWDCPTCMVPNKATNDICACCSHVMYASTSSSNVFGSRAFKPLATTGSAVQFGVSGSSTKPPAFGFGASKPADVLSAAPASTIPATTGFGFTATKPAVSAEPVKPVGSLFGNLGKPADSTATTTPPTAVAATSSTPSLFGNNAKSLFGATKTEPDNANATKPSMFGSILNKEAPTTTTPAVSAPSTSLTSASSTLFGSSSLNTSFGGTSLFGSQKPNSEIPKPTPTLSFGAASSTSTNEVPQKSLFGNIPSTSAPAPVLPTPSSTTSLFGSTSSSSNLFTTKPADSTTSSIFGKPIQFSGEVGTTTTDGGVPAKRGMFSTDAPKLSFGGEQKVELPKFGGFGGSSSSSTAPSSSGSLFSGGSAQLFGTSSSNAPAFASSSSTTVPSFGGSSTVPFGSSTTSSGFGAFGSKPTQPGMSTSSSTNSLFSQPTADSSNPFGTTNSNGFNFGASSSTSSTGGQAVFQFGGAPAPAPNAAPGGAFQFGNNLAAPSAPAPGSMDNAFAYQAPSGNNPRKMALARRRNMRK